MTRKASKVPSLSLYFFSLPKTLILYFSPIETQMKGIGGDCSMRLEPQKQWIDKNSANGKTARVLDIEQTVRQEVLIQLDLGWTSIFKDNLNRCIAAWGEESDNWIGKTMLLQVETQATSGKRFLLMLPNK